METATNQVEYSKVGGTLFQRNRIAYLYIFLSILFLR